MSTRQANNNIFTIFALALFIGALGCTEAPPLKKKPKKHPMGSLCKKTLAPTADQLEKVLEEKKTAQALELFQKLAQKGSSIKEHFYPIMDRENLTNFNLQADWLTKQANQGIQMAKKKDQKAMEDALENLRQGCENCHLTYRQEEE